MVEILEIVSAVLGAYIVVIALVMVVTKSNFQEAREIVARKLKNNSEYMLKYDQNYIREIEAACEEILGEKRYKNLCSLSKYSRAIDFCESKGYPSVHITVSPNDENEKTQIENILVQITSNYVCNYRNEDYEVISEWSENRVLRLPVLIIGYSRNPKETEAIRRKKKSEIERVIISTNVETYDEDLQ